MDDSLTRLIPVLETIEDLCVSNNEFTPQLLPILKSMYDTRTSRVRSFGPFDELIIDGMDPESIWEELQSRNKPLTRYIKSKISRIWSALRHQEVAKSSREAKKPTSDESADFDSKDDDDYERPAAELNLDGNEDDETDDFEVNEGNDDFEDSDVEGHSEAFENDSDADGMESWLDYMDTVEDKRHKKSAKLSRGHKGVVEDEEADEDDFDIIDRELYADDDDEDENPEQIMHSDFFDEKKTIQISKTNAVKYKRDLLSMEEAGDELGSDHEEFADDGSEAPSDDDEPEEGDDVDGGSVGSAGEKLLKSSKYEQKKKKLMAEISGIETDLVSRKSWELRGEVKSIDRPENSLLGVSADIERASKPVPVITQDFTRSLEDIIIDRIKNGKFDNVEFVNKAAPRENAEEEMLSQERSKVGLGEIYANEFLASSMQQTQGGRSIAQKELLAEVQDLFHLISRELDGLSHFHFTPKPVVSEASIASSQGAEALPTIALEDIAPVSATTATVSSAAPEEILAKKRGREAAFVSEAEMTSEDKKRLRRAKKAVRRRQRAADGTTQRNTEAQETDSRVREGKVDAAAAYGKSAEFFSNLQRQAQEDIGKKKSGKTAKATETASKSTGSFKL